MSIATETPNLDKMRDKLAEECRPLWSADTPTTPAKSHIEAWRDGEGVFLVQIWPEQDSYAIYKQR